jgi:hypothetical protein
MFRTPEVTYAVRACPQGKELMPDTDRRVMRQTGGVAVVLLPAPALAQGEPAGIAGTLVAGSLSIGLDVARQVRCCWQAAPGRKDPTESADFRHPSRCGITPLPGKGLYFPMAYGKQPE